MDDTTVILKLTVEDVQQAAKEILDRNSLKKKWNLSKIILMSMFNYTTVYKIASFGESYK